MLFIFMVTKFEISKSVALLIGFPFLNKYAKN